MKTFSEFQKDIVSLACDLLDQYDVADALDYVHETVEGVQAVIYYAQAWDLVNMVRECNYSLYQDAQAMVSDDIAMEDNETDLNKLMTYMAYAIYTIELTEYLNKKGA